MNFEVVPASVPVFRQDRLRAMEAPVSELPTLSDVQAAEIRQFCLNEEEYKRLRVLPRKYALERQQRQGTQFGQWIESIIEPLGNGYRLESVNRRGAPTGWNVVIRDGQSDVVEFRCSLEVVQAIAEGSATERQLQGFRHDILAELGQTQALEAVG
jgi:hypothetical protein